DPVRSNLLGHAQTTGIECIQCGLDGGLNVCVSGGGREVGTVFPCQLDGALQVCSHRGTQWFKKAAMRSAASIHCCFGASRSMRIRFAPGLTPWASRARKLPGRVVTPVVPNRSRTKSVSA